MRHFHLTVVVLVAISANAHALTSDDLLFYAPLDGTLDATVSRGASAPRQQPASPQFVEGHHGLGLLTGGAGSELTYATAGNMDVAAGSVAMWIKPIDWGVDSYMRFFFTVNEAPEAGAGWEGNFLWLYKYFHLSVYWLVQQESPQQAVYLVAPRTTNGDVGGDVHFDWQPGKWSHLIGAWSGNQMTLYINGQYVGTTYTPTPRVLRKLWDVFHIGGPNRRGNGTADTVINEVMVLRRPVTPGEAQLLYGKGRDAFDGKDARLAQPLFKLVTGYLPSHDQISATFSVVGRRPDELADLTIRYQINSAKDGSAVREGSIPMREVQQTELLDGRALPQGEYQFRATLLEQNPQGAAIAEANGSFEKMPPAQWLGNKLGITEVVPAPWTPLACTGTTATCWGRTYEWRQNIFPAQIITAGQTMLARPITLVGVVDGKACSVSPGVVHWKGTTATRAEFTATAEMGGLPVQVTGWVEFDGLIWSRITISPRLGAKLSALALEIPMRSEAATLMQGRLPVPQAGKVRDFKGVLRFSPVIWVGNEKGGVQWSTEDTRDWKLRDDENMAGLTVGPTETVLRLTLVDQTISLDHPLQYSMGWQATPVKPMNPDRHAWEAELGNYTGKLGWAFYWQQWNRIGKQSDGIYGYQVASANTYADLQDCRSNHKMPWIYWHQHAVWAGDPVARAYGDEWGGTYQAAANPFTAIIADHSKSSIRDYLVWLNWKLLKDNPELAKGVRGYYIDCAQAGWTKERSDGIVYNRFTVLGTRELQERFFVMVRQNWPELLIANHQSGEVNLSQLAFSDMMVTGEQLADDPHLSQDLGYYHVLTLDGMRAEYSGANFGLPMVFLPEITHCVEGDAARVKAVLGPAGLPAAEHLLGLLWVHDVIPWPAYINLAPFAQAGRAKRAFGWDRDTKFEGYWENAKLVQIQADQSPVVASVFIRDGKALFVVMNNSDADAQVELSPQWKALGINAPTMLADAYAEHGIPAVHTTIPLTGGHAKLTVKARNFRALAAD